MTTLSVSDTGDKTWRQDGRLHREDGPAVELANGHREWYRHGDLHRENGPAFEAPNGEKGWWRNGQLHRTDGPAVTGADSQAWSWYENGRPHRLDGPAYMDEGAPVWCVRGFRLEDADVELVETLDPQVCRQVLALYDPLGNLGDLVDAVLAART
jgi:hypothetical protein